MTSMPVDPSPASDERLRLQARILTTIIDNARTWQAGDQSVYDPVLVTVSDAAELAAGLLGAERDAAVRQGKLDNERCPHDGATFDEHYQRGYRQGVDDALDDCDGCPHPVAAHKNAGCLVCNCRIPLDLRIEERSP